MLKQLTRSFATAAALIAVALIVAVASSSALPTRLVRPAQERAARGGPVTHEIGRRARRKSGAVVHRSVRQLADITTSAVLLGEDAVESEYDSLATGQAEAFRLRSHVSGAAGAVHVFISWRNAASTLVVGLYSDANGHPGVLLSTGSAPASRAETWTAVPISRLELLAGRSYWLAVLGRGGVLRYRDRWRGPCPSETSAQTSLGTLPLAWKTGTLYQDCPASAYVTAEPLTLPQVLGSPQETGSSLAPSVPVVPAEPLTVAPEEPTPPVSPAAPQDTSPPAITGTAVEAQVLSVSPGVWSGSPTSFSYRWQDCDTAGGACVNANGATESTFTPSAGDVGHTLRVVVTASNAGGSSSASSAATAPVLPLPPANTGPPSIAGSAVHGETLSASSGAWSGSPSSFVYQWEDCDALGEACLSIAGATASSYKLAEADVGETLRVVVRATNAGGAGSASSSATAIVLPQAPTDTVPPSVSGTTVEGETLSASNGTWSGSPSSFSYRWQDCNTVGGGCVDISGATASSYTLRAVDVGDTIRVVLSASNAGGSTQASSAATEVIAPDPPPAPAPTNMTLPTVAGVAVAGEALTASAGTWSGSPTSFSYQWQDCNAAGESCSNLGGATGASHSLAAGDVGHSLRVVVTASNAGGSSSASSAATGVVVPLAPRNTVLPSIGGVVVEGEALTASAGTWSGSPTSFSYQWQDCNASGAGCANLSGAAASSYKLSSSDVGHTLRVVVAASNAGGAAQATSVATGLVAAKEKEAGTPTNCFANPESCHYPGPNNEGPNKEGAAHCSSLPASGEKTITKAGQVVENLNITGKLTIAAAKVTVNNVCVTYNGKAIEGSEAIRIEDGANEATISNSTIRGENESTKSVEIALSNAYGSTGLVATKDYIYNCGECIHYAWTVNESYVLVNGMANTNDHYEDWYFNNNTISANDDTMLNSYKQTAVLFGNANNGSGGGCTNHMTVTNSLLSGGGAMLYPCGNASSVGSSTMTIKNNRFARMKCAKKEHQIPAGQYGEGGWECEKDEGTGGFWPRGGFFYTAAYIFSGAGQSWEGNFWDDNLEPIAP